MKSLGLVLALCPIAALASGCGDDGDSTDNPDGASQYALATIVFGPDPSSDMTYVSVFDSLDITQVDLTKAFPFPGDADIATYGGKLYVSSGESPTIERFAYAGGKLTSEGVLSFANLGLTIAPLRGNAFVSATKAYLELPNGAFAVWDPSTMSLKKTIDVPDLDRGEDQTLDGSTPVVRGNRIYRTYYWEDWSTYTFSTEQYVATFDTDNDTFLGKVAEAQCPNLGAAGQIDSQGNIYFSNWYYNIPGTLMKDAPKSCAVRIPAGSDTVDPSWSLVFADIDGGHEGTQLSLVGDGKAVFSAFHEEKFTITADTEPYDIPSALLWESWGVDLSTKAATALPNVAYSIADQGVFVLGDRTFLLAPGTDWESMQAYELMADGTTRSAFPIGGWSRGFFQLK